MQTAAQCGEKLPERRLGLQGLKVGAIGFGTMGMTMAYGNADGASCFAAIQKAYELGVTLFDTAEVYGMGVGSNELLLGRAVQGFRDEIVLATKFGFDLSTPEWNLDARNSRPENIRRVAENSLRYLGVDHIDILYQHRVDPDVPIEDVAGTVSELVAEGKVRYFGLSEASPDVIRRAHLTYPVSVLQSPYSMFDRTVEDGVLPALRELGIGFVCHSPLASGFLTCAVKPVDEYPMNDTRRWHNLWQSANYERNLRANRELTKIADEKGISVTQLALAWLLAQGDDIVPIPGTRSEGRVVENVAAARTSITSEELTRIQEVLSEYL
ncbi:aldo/keto reductase [Nocardia terpenica]|uniref:Aldo/keto reductase n=1 Tax=Nocardia terpenica TaxID=455432 RepID=A0A6G9Z9S6_9NOCA|nr:aldo/keto reductase [Nocardia terpenica]QIS22151.1 aldo/keto reductase [Nocardia terpenica]